METGGSIADNRRTFNGAECRLSSVREAIRILNQQHILLVEQGRGTFVREDLPTEDDRGAVAFLEKASWLQLTEARRIMEPELAAMAAINRTQQQAEALLANAAAMARKAGKGQDFLKEDLTFHRLIAEAAGNDVILHMLGVISDLLLDSRRKTMRIHGMDEKASSYHTLIARSDCPTGSKQGEGFNADAHSRYDR